MQIIKTTLLITIILTFSFKTFGQNYRSQQNQIFAYNILSNGIIGGMGGVINKKKGEKILPVFFKNFGKGCLGGLIKYSAKKQAHYFKNSDNLFLAPFNRAFFFLGHSITTNAAMNKRTLENYYLNLYGIDFTFQPYEQRGNRLQARISLGTAISVISATSHGHKLDFYKTLEYGQFYFDLNTNAAHNSQQINGLAYYNGIAIRKSQNAFQFQRVVPHEIVHTYQYYDFFPLSSFYKTRLDKLLNKSKWYRFATKYVSFDYEPTFFYAIYHLQPKSRYYRNFFEFEAEHFSTRRYIGR